MRKRTGLQSCNCSTYWSGNEIQPSLCRIRTCWPRHKYRRYCMKESKLSLGIALRWRTWNIHTDSVQHIVRHSRREVRTKLQAWKNKISSLLSFFLICTQIFINWLFSLTCFYSGFRPEKKLSTIISRNLMVAIHFQLTWPITEWFSLVHDKGSTTGLLIQLVMLWHCKTFKCFRVTNKHHTIGVHHCEQQTGETFRIH